MKRDTEKERELTERAIGYFYSTPISTSDVIQLQRAVCNSNEPMPIPSDLSEEITDYFCQVWGGTSYGRKQASIFHKKFRERLGKLQFISYFNGHLAVRDEVYDEYERDMEKLNRIIDNDDEYFSLLKEIKNKWWLNENLPERNKK